MPLNLVTCTSGHHADEIIGFIQSHIVPALFFISRTVRFDVIGSRAICQCHITTFCKLRQLAILIIHEIPAKLHFCAAVIDLHSCRERHLILADFNLTCLSAVNRNICLLNLIYLAYAKLPFRIITSIFITRIYEVVAILQQIISTLQHLVCVIRDCPGSKFTAV